MQTSKVLTTSLSSEIRGILDGQDVQSVRAAMWIREPEMDGPPGTGDDLQQQRSSFVGATPPYASCRQRLHTRSGSRVKPYSDVTGACSHVVTHMGIREDAILFVQPCSDWQSTTSETTSEFKLRMCCATLWLPTNLIWGLCSTKCEAVRRAYRRCQHIARGHHKQ
jgi:hypothetical protein